MISDIYLRMPGRKNLGSHPSTYYGGWFIYLKVILILVVSFTFIVDFGINNFIPFPGFFHYRIILVIIPILLIFILLSLELNWFRLIKCNEKQTFPKNSLNWWDAVWDNYKHADNLYHHRFNFFLVAESMLVVSFATTLLVNPVNSNIFTYSNQIRIAIAILGMMFTLSWFYVNKRLDWRLVYLNNEYLTKNEDYNKYMESVDDFTIIHTGFFLSNLLPLFTFAFWYFLFYISRWQII